MMCVGGEKVRKEEMDEVRLAQDRLLSDHTIHVHSAQHGDSTSRNMIDRP